MSHISTLKTQCKVQAHLRTALEQTEGVYRLSEATETTFADDLKTDFNQRLEECQFTGMAVIDRSQTAQAFGYKMGENGFFELVCDRWSWRGAAFDQFSKMVNQAYAQAAVTAELVAQGYTLETVTDQNGTKTLLFNL